MFRSDSNTTAPVTTRTTLLDIAERIDSLADVAWIVEEGAVGAVVVNAGYESVWGGQRAALLANADAWLDAVLPDYRAAAQQLIEAADRSAVTLATGCAAGVRWMRVRATRFAADRTFVLVQCTDVSEFVWRAQQADLERSRLRHMLETHETALEQVAARLGHETSSREEAERLLLDAERVKVLGRLTPGIAHDFNNVLAIVSGTLHLIRKISTDDSQRNLVGRGLRAITSASELVKSLNAFAAGKATGERPLDLHRAIRDISQMLRQAVGAQISLDMRLEATGWVLADPHQLQMALLNLAINARDAMPDGGRLEVETADVTSPHEERAYVEITVRDSGSGMTPEQLIRATEPFFTTKASGRGTGLGLPMVDAFARSSGGTLTLQSELGVGTAARLRLVRVPPVTQGTDTPPAATIDRSRHGDATVLVVEDDPLLRPITAAYVRDLGYRVLEAADAVEALAIDARTPDLALVLTDIELPGLDGVALAERLRAGRPDLGVLFVTAHAEWARSGGRHVLQKPFDQPALAARILSALHRDGCADVETEISRHIVHPALRGFYRQWDDVRRQTGVPRYEEVRTAVEPHSAMAVIARVISGEQSKITCAFEHIGSELVSTYSSALGAKAQIIDSIEAAYEECAVSGKPSYESVRYRLGNDPPVRFERVIVPCSDAQSLTVSHLVGLVAFTNLPVAPPPQ